MLPTAVDITDGMPAATPIYVKHPPAPKPGEATIAMPMKDRKVPVRGASDGTLAGSVLELAQTLTKNNAILREVNSPRAILKNIPSLPLTHLRVQFCEQRSEEKARLGQIIGEFRKHLQWQTQRKQQLKRNLERLHNETKWLNDKASEVKQDTNVISNELRQATSELDKLKAVRDARKLELDSLEQELKLEHNSATAVNQLVNQAHKALNAHSKERDAWKAEADRAQAEARKLKDKLEEMAYRINGLAAGAL